MQRTRPFNRACRVIRRVTRRQTTRRRTTRRRPTRRRNSSTGVENRSTNGANPSQITVCDCGSCKSGIRTHDPATILHYLTPGANFMCQKLRVKFLLAEFLWTLMDYFLHFFVEHMFILKFCRNNYSELKQNLLPEKGGSFHSTRRNFTHDFWFMKLAPVQTPI